MGATHDRIARSSRHVWRIGIGGVRHYLQVTGFLTSTSILQTALRFRCLSANGFGMRAGREHRLRVAGMVTGC